MFSVDNKLENADQLVSWVKTNLWEKNTLENKLSKVNNDLTCKKESRTKNFEHFLP